MLRVQFSLNKRWRVVIYARMSSDRQNPRSPEQQIATIEETIHRSGLDWVVVKTYRDDGISGGVLLACGWKIADDFQVSVTCLDFDGTTCGFRVWFPGFKGMFTRRSGMDLSHLSPEKQAEAARIVDVAMAKARAEITQAAALVASKADGELFGQTEFQIRDMAHRVGAALLDAALEERKKGGTSGRRPAVRIATSRPGSSSTAPGT